MSESTGQDDILYLHIEHILDLYADLLECTLQEAADQLRDANGLEGALGRPEQYAYYEGADLALQAAVLAHGIAEGQYFLDGNKRLALLALLLFLDINGFDLNATQEQREMWIFEFSLDLTPSGLGERIRTALIPILPE